MCEGECRVRGEAGGGAAAVACAMHITQSKQKQNTSTCNKEKLLHTLSGFACILCRRRWALEILANAPLPAHLQEKVLEALPAEVHTVHTRCCHRYHGSVYISCLPFHTVNKAISHHNLVHSLYTAHKILNFSKAPP